MKSDATVFVVDDDPGVLFALQQLIASLSLPCESYSDAVTFLEYFDAERPGCLLLDVRMPGMNGLELLSHLRKRHSTLPVILITGHGDIPMCVQAMHGGAYHFLEKPFPPAKLADLIGSAVAADRTFREEHQTLADTRCRLASLEEEERAALDLIMEGKVNKEIAADLDVSLRTVQFRVSSLMHKMGVDTRIGLIRLLMPLFRAMSPSERVSELAERGAGAGS